MHYDLPEGWDDWTEKQRQDFLVRLYASSGVDDGEHVLEEYSKTTGWTPGQRAHGVAEYSGRYERDDEVWCSGAGCDNVYYPSASLADDPDLYCSLECEERTK